MSDKTNADKIALVIDAVDADYEMHQWKPRLQHRFVNEKCEENESVLQLLPYIGIQREEDDAILLYTRGKKGGEARLHNQKSIGLGGHVEIAPKVQGDVFELQMLLAKEAARECEEEANIPALEVVLPIYEALRAGKYRRLYLKTGSAVDRVHLGIALFIRIPGDLVGAVQDGHIVDPTWVTVDELRALRDQEASPLENWSKKFDHYLHLAR